MTANPETTPKPVDAPKDEEAKAAKVKLNRESMAKLYSLSSFVAPTRHLLFIAAVLTLFTSAMGTSFPALASYLIDSKTHTEAFHWAGLLFTILLIQGILTYIQSVTYNRVGQGGLALLRETLFGHLTEMPTAFFSRHQVGELMSRLSADVTQLEDLFVFAVPQFLRQTTILSGSIVMMCFMSPALTGVMIASFPPTIIVAILLGRQVGKHSRKAQDQLAGSTSIIEEALQNIATVKAYANERFEQKRYRSHIDTYLEAVMATAKARGLLVAFIIFGIFSAIVVVLWFGTTLLIDGSLQKGQLLGFFFYTIFVGGALQSFSDLYSNLRKSLGATERVRELLDESTEPLEAVETPGTGVKLPPAAELKGEIRFDRVFFSYPSRLDVSVLQGMDFTIPAGQVVALVGPSGAGKSTIVSLLLRFFEPTSGQILFDGHGSQLFSRHDLRRQMALVPQEVLLFAGSIAENIAYGKPGSSQEEIEQAAKLAYAHDFITQFPEGYKTVVGDRGIQLSGGQRQRIAIARALLKNPKILILDEATSALDAESEHFVQMALETLMKGRTCVIVAHRLSTIRKANAILVLRDGKILESGSHDELMGNPDGAYRRIVHIQSGGIFSIDPAVPSGP